MGKSAPSTFAALGERWRSDGSGERRGRRGWPCRGVTGGRTICNAASASRRRGPTGGKPCSNVTAAWRVSGIGAQRGRSHAEKSSRDVRERRPCGEGKVDDGTTGGGSGGEGGKGDTH
eukprot:scaffold9703_cov83-Cylindrotheca_fusiformis.AAC.2